jgi:branched-chain amino acid transport system ATP-binding protein
MLAINGLRVLYGNVAVLNDVSILVDEGETVVLVGSNGAGKSTLLRTISGLVRARSGTMRYKGEFIHNLPSHKIVEKGIVHVPEGRGIFPYLTVHENLKMGSFLKGARSYEKESLRTVFAFFPILQDRINQEAGTLSGGELQMLAIGRGLMSRPNLLLLDEPSLGLAPQIVKQIFRIVKQITDEGITVLLVEQNVKRALQIADRGYVLENGRIVLEGAGEALLNDDYVRKAYLGI